MPSRDPRLNRILEDAALLQQKVPDAVLVGGSAAAYYANHRLSYDHDHVLSDLDIRFQSILEALEADPEYVVNLITPGKIILGEHNGIEYGIRQLLRKRPLEVVEETLPSGKLIRVPTVEEALRIKAYLLVKRNFTRDYLDVAALSAHMNELFAASVLMKIDDYYSDPAQDNDSVASQLVCMFLEPAPADPGIQEQLGSYKQLQPRWHEWKSVTSQLFELAKLMRGEN